MSVKKMESENKFFLLVTGMHRSGTSFLVRALNLCGVYLGSLDSLISNDWNFMFDNLKGHWENKEFLELAEKILRTNNGAWDKIPEKISVNDQIRNELQESIKHLSSHPSLACGYKDPRILLYLESLFDSFPENTVIVGIFREPHKVAESLKKRNEFSYKKSMELWKIYNQNLLSMLEKHPGFLLNFDWPKEKLIDEILMISKKLNLSGNIDLSKLYTKEIITRLV